MSESKWLSGQTALGDDIAEVARGVVPRVNNLRKKSHAMQGLRRRLVQTGSDTRAAPAEEEVEDDDEDDQVEAAAAVVADSRPHVVAAAADEQQKDDENDDQHGGTPGPLIAVILPPLPVGAVVGVVALVPVNVVAVGFVFPLEIVRGFRGPVSGLTGTPCPEDRNHQC